MQLAFQLLNMRKRRPPSGKLLDEVQTGVQILGRRIRETKLLTRTIPTPSRLVRGHFTIESPPKAGWCPTGFRRKLKPIERNIKVSATRCLSNPLDIDILFDVKARHSPRASNTGLLISESLHLQHRTGLCPKKIPQ